MAFDSFSAFVAMGKHGPYVWSAFGVSALVLAWNVVQPLLRRRQLVRELRASWRREQNEDEVM